MLRSVRVLATLTSAGAAADTIVLEALTVEFEAARVRTVAVLRRGAFVGTSQVGSSVRGTE